MIIKNLESYKDEMEDDIASALFHYQNGDYEKFGAFLGNLMKAAAEGKKEDLFLY